MTETSTGTTIPGYVAGTWTIDTVHSEVGFSVRHMMVSKVRGKFTKFEGEITTGESLLDSSVSADVELSSIDTGNEMRDNHLRSADFFEADKHPKWTYASTSVDAKGSDFVVHGNLTIHGVTRPVDLELEFNGVGGDPWGGTRAGFSASTGINRKDFGLEFNIPLEGGGVVVGDKVKVELEIEAVLAQG
jgi:polyisoprenoid-binding protein YceI